MLFVLERAVPLHGLGSCNRASTDLLSLLPLSCRREQMISMIAKQVSTLAHFERTRGALR